MYHAVPLGGLIIEAVRAAVERCDAVIALITCNSLGSAWSYSEVHTARQNTNRPIWAFVDGRDLDLITLIRTYDMVKPASLRQDLVGRLKQRYAAVEDASHRVASHERVLRDQLDALSYFLTPGHQGYSGAALFPPSTNVESVLAGFSDPASIIGYLTSERAGRIL